jgi:hypothetical protein
MYVDTMLYTKPPPVEAAANLGYGPADLGNPRLTKEAHGLARNACHTHGY